MMLKGKAESLEQDESREIRRGTHLPTVIRLRQFVRVPFRQVPLTRRNVFYRDNHSCQYCGCSGEPLSIDHVIPRSRGGPRRLGQHHNGMSQLQRPQGKSHAEGSRDALEASAPSSLEQPEF